MKKERISFRIQFDKGVVQYLEDYKRDNKVSVQKFVELAVEEKIKNNQAMYDGSGTNWVDIDEVGRWPDPVKFSVKDGKEVASESELAKFLLGAKRRLIIDNTQSEK